MPNNSLMDQSCRVALAALLHDLGKFAERARIEEAGIKNKDGVTQKSIAETMYCPEFKGHYTHIHAAYTSLALDLLEKDLPPMVGEDPKPFGSWNSRENADDSFINAAARHHRPETALQWIVATADRLASGFERETFEKYNQAPDEEEGKNTLNHYTTRQWSLFESIHMEIGPASSQTPSWRYPLLPLTPETIFPVKETEHRDKARAQKEYLTLWDGFREGLKQIPPDHRKNLPLWLDHFESLWLTYTHAIPAATAGMNHSLVRPEVSLYDHSKTVAALGVALWRYHLDRKDTPEAIVAELSDRHSDKGASTEKYLLLQGDFFGIQNFIFTEGSQTQKYAAKLLRGRSFYVGILNELAALRILETLSLPSTSQVMNAAGKFMIVAPNTDDTIQALEMIQKEIDDWFLEQTHGRSGIGLCWHPAKGHDFAGEKEKGNVFQGLMRDLFQKMEDRKLSRFDLCTQPDAKMVFSDFLDRFEHGECQIDGRSPGEVEVGGIYISRLSRDQINTGALLTKNDVLLVARDKRNQDGALSLPIFGYYPVFVRRNDRVSDLSSILRSWDFSLPRQDSRTDSPFWRGWAKRQFNTYVPRIDRRDALDDGRYKGIEEDEDTLVGDIKTLNHLARDDWKRSEKGGSWIGVEALSVIKGDIDNLGQIFQTGLIRPNFAKMATLSRQVNAFFTIYLPWLCQTEFRNTYTVFAGGDDFFLIGPWFSTVRLAERMRQEFHRYVAGNIEIHFSAGISVIKPGLPIRQMATLSEEALYKAKSFDNGKKNAVTLFERSVHWDTFTDLLKNSDRLENLISEHRISTAYVYGLIRLCEMAGSVKGNPYNSLWRSWFAYRTRRFLDRAIQKVGKGEKTEARIQKVQSDLAGEIADGIGKYKEDYKISLFTYLYQQRD